MYTYLINRKIISYNFHIILQIMQFITFLKYMSSLLYLYICNIHIKCRMI